jgi:hypothetical protein
MPLETPLNETEKNFLIQLYQQTEGDQNRKVDTAAIGSGMGMDKTDSRKISEELIGHGFVEVKTLSGGIGITAEGLAEAERLGVTPTGAQARLANTPIINSDGRKTVESVLEQLKKSIYKNRSNFDEIAELVMDIKTIEVQLLSPKPKTAIVKACLASMLKVLERGETKSAQLIQSLVD